MPLAHIAQIIKHFLPEPIGSPLVTVLFTKGMIAADFLGDPTGNRVGHAISRARPSMARAIPDKPSRTATRSRSCIGSIGDPHGRTGARTIPGRSTFQAPQNGRRIPL